MIIWLNGAFGAGKTQTAAELKRRLAGAFLYDPENVGYWLRENEPKQLQRDNFQDEPLWRAINRDMLLHLAAHYDGTILVPMTLVRAQYYREIVSALRQQGVEVCHVLLLPGMDTLRRRLSRRGERSSSWAWRQAADCYRAFADPVFENRIENDNMSVEETAEAVAALAGLTLAPRAGRCKGAWARLVTTLRAIRR